MADNYTFKDASGNTQTHASKDVGAGVQATRHIDVDESNTAIAKAEDAAHVSGDKGYMLLAVRKDTAAALAGSDGDYIPLIVDSSGRLHVAIGSGGIGGDIAHDSADSGNPVKIGGKAYSSTPNPVTANDRVNAFFDLYGRQVVKVGIMTHEPPNEYAAMMNSGSVASGGYGWGFANPSGGAKTILVDQIWLGAAEACVLSLYLSHSWTQSSDQAANGADLRMINVSSTAKLVVGYTPASQIPMLTLPFYAGEKILLEFNGALKLPAPGCIVPKKESGTTGVIYFNIVYREE